MVKTDNLRPMKNALHVSIYCKEESKHVPTEYFVLSCSFLDVIANMIAKTVCNIT